MSNEKIPSKEVYSGATFPVADIEKPGQHFQQYSEYAQQSRWMLIKQVNDIQERQKSWLGKLGLSQSERQMLQTYWDHQQEALGTAMQEHNRGMKAIGEAQVSFVREVCNTLLMQGRANLQFGRSVQYQEQSLQLHAVLEEKNRRFWDIFEEKIKDAQSRPEYLRSAIMKQAEAMLDRWNQQFEDILNDFLAVFKERV